MIWLINILVIVLLGGMFIVVPFLLGFSDIYTCKRCKKEIKAKYIGKDPLFTWRHLTTYAPKFEYILDGKNYCNTALQPMEKEYTYGEEYSVYVDEKDPYMIAISKKANPCSYFFLGISILGVVFFVYAFCMGDLFFAM